MHPPCETRTESCGKLPVVLFFFRRYPLHLGGSRLELLPADLPYIVIRERGSAGDARGGSWKRQETRGSIPSPPAAHGIILHVHNVFPSYDFGRRDRPAGPGRVGFSPWAQPCGEAIWRFPAVHFGLRSRIELCLAYMCVYSDWPWRGVV